MGRSYAAAVHRTAVLAVVLVQLLCLVRGAVAGTSLLAKSRPQRGSAQLRYSSTDALAPVYIGRQSCVAKTGLDVTKAKLNAYCGGEGLCVPQ